MLRTIRGSVPFTGSGFARFFPATAIGMRIASLYGTIFPDQRCSPHPKPSSDMNSTTVLSGRALQSCPMERSTPNVVSSCAAWEWLLNAAMLADHDPCAM